MLLFFLHVSEKQINRAGITDRRKKNTERVRMRSENYVRGTSRHSFMHVSKVIKSERVLIEKMLFVGGYKSIKNTLIYIDLDVACYPKSNDNYVSRVAGTEQEICSCIESGFEYVWDFSGSQDLQETKVSGIKNFTICPKVSRFGRVAHLKFSEWL